MGFRSTFVSEQTCITWPEWFKEKYGDGIIISNSILLSAWEDKTYMYWEDLPSDIQKAIDWDKYNGPFVFVYLHECGGITRCQITKDLIKFSEPEKWKIVEDVTHNYCYGCSDV